MRCMANDTMVKEFPETDQRLAVCSSTYEESKLKKDKKNEQNNASPSLLKHETKYANKRLD